MEPKSKILLKTTNEELVAGFYVPYPNSNVGCGFIVRLPIIVNSLGNGEKLESWESVTEEEAWQAMDEWVKNR